MDKNFSDKNKKTIRPSNVNNKTAGSSKDDLLKLKKELEEKKRLLEQKLLEVEKGNQQSKSSIKSKTPKTAIKNRLNTDDIEKQEEERRARIPGRKNIAKKIKLDDDDAGDQKPKIKIKNNFDDSSWKSQRDDRIEKIKSSNDKKVNMLLNDEKQQNEELKVKISSKYQNKPLNNDSNNDDDNTRPRLRVKSNAIHYANEKKQQVEAGVSESKNVIKVTQADTKLFNKTPNVIITNRLDDGQSEFHFSDIVEGRSSVNDGEIELLDEEAENEKHEQHIEKQRVKISETSDDYKAFGDDVEGEYGSKLAFDKHQKGKLVNRDNEEIIYEDDDNGSSIEDMNIEVKSLVGEEKMANPLPSISKNTKSRRVFRHELKYYISWADYVMLSKSLNCLMKHDNNADPITGDYYIRSLYFDDFKNSALTEKLSGIENRKKYRIRIYGLKDDLIRVERKNKTKDYISKDNLTLTRQEYDSIIAGDIEFLLKKENQLAKDFYYEIKTKRLEPCVIVDYVREAFVHPIKNLRITFDKMVKSGRYDRSIFKQDVALASVLPPGTVVLEVKFEKGLPDYIIGALNTISACNRSAISKYALCRKYES